ncbi:hypothetical protein Q0Z83_058420 [Actinoplanes sichuanensis]|uniref:DUF222 domain-containing protein n=1 Tax=Actinoplanes sichuanensis TaxID=512349 RepID=A0ABW4APB0_9ACTN|nr:hypothetical protein [Actinoplanes sichuanensis]BEL07651.1 hypothetical protein Q0Z83_058420 [Actinoplanes sichuanensis]
MNQPPGLPDPDHPRTLSAADHLAYPYWEKALDLNWAMRFAGAPGDDVPPGLRGLAWLAGIHSATMANGMNSALEHLTPEQVTEAVDFATRIGLHDIAALITLARTAEPSDDHGIRYRHLSHGTSGDAGAILEAVRRDLAANPAHWDPP